MDEPDTGSYLTYRLRRLSPEYFEQELARRSRRARWAGFVIGVVSALIILAVAFTTLFMVDGSFSMLSAQGFAQ